MVALPYGAAVLARGVPYLATVGAAALAAYDFARKATQAVDIPADSLRFLIS